MFRRQAAISLSRRGDAYSPRSVNIAREPNDYELSVRQVVVSTIAVSTQRFPVVQSFITVATHERNFVIGVQTRACRDIRSFLEVLRSRCIPIWPCRFEPIVHHPTGMT